MQNKIKKHVWQKISDIISTKLGLLVTGQQCDTKWKGLKDMYKNIKKHNETTGNSPKQWVFYDIIDEFLHKKPEIIAPATFSSHNGLQRQVADSGKWL